jgi:hypothetical protein
MGIGRKIFVGMMVVLFTAKASFAAPQLDSRHTVGVSAKITEAGIVLTVRYDPGLTPNLFEALRVYSLPSETLLLAHYDPNTDLEQRSGVSTSLGQMTAFQHVVVLPENIVKARSLADERKISVRLVFEGNEYVVSEGSVGFTDFQVTSRFDPDLLIAPTKQPVGPVSRIGNCGSGQWEHCSGGPRCVYGCICCGSAYFCTNLITCTLECGTGPC